MTIFKIIINIDRQIILVIDKHVTNELLILFLNFFTYIGYFGICWVLLFSVYTIMKKDKTILYSWGTTYIAATLLSEWFLKYICQRSRPFVELAGLTIQTLKPGSPSFPSGHALFSGAAVFFFFTLENNRLARLTVLILSLLISLSRIILKVHYPSDVAAGYLIGIAVAFVVNKLPFFSVQNKRQ